MPLSSFHQKADNRTCRLSTISKMSFPAAGKQKSDLCENNALTHFSVAHSTYSQTTVERRLIASNEKKGLNTSTQRCWPIEAQTNEGQSSLNSQCSLNSPQHLTVL